MFTARRGFAGSRILQGTGRGGGGLDSGGARAYLWAMERRMPPARLILLLATVIAMAGLTIWAVVGLGGPGALPALGLVSLLAVVVLWLMRR